MDILKQVETADWDRERLNMSVNTPASWSADALRMRLGMPSGPEALQGITLLNVGHGEREPTVLGSGPRWWHCVILKAGKEGV